MLVLGAVGLFCLSGGELQAIKENRKQALAALCHNPDAKPMQWRIRFPSSLLPFRRWASSSCHKQVT